MPRIWATQRKPARCARFAVHGNRLCHRRTLSGSIGLRWIDWTAPQMHTHTHTKRSRARFRQCGPRGSNWIDCTAPRMHTHTAQRAGIPSRETCGADGWIALRLNYTRAPVGRFFLRPVKITSSIGITEIQSRIPPIAFSGGDCSSAYATADRDVRRHSPEGRNVWRSSKFGGRRHLRWPRHRWASHGEPTKPAEAGGWDQETGQPSGRSTRCQTCSSPQSPMTSELFEIRAENVKACCYAACNLIGSSTPRKKKKITITSSRQAEKVLAH